MTRKLIEQMLDALITASALLDMRGTAYGDVDEAINVATEYLAAPEQSEPFAWAVPYRDSQFDLDPEYVIDRDHDLALARLSDYNQHHSQGTPIALYITPQPTTPEPVNQMLLDTINSIYIYANDTLSGRTDGPDDRDWQRACVIEVRNRARKYATVESAIVARATIAAAEKAPQPTELTDTRCKVKLGKQYGGYLAGHWFFLQPADELADKALEQHSGIAAQGASK